MPALINGEDRAFTSAVRQAGFIVRHAIDIEVVTSGRLEGRAAGGCADTMRLRCEIPDSPCDERLERFDRALTAYPVAPSTSSASREGRSIPHPTLGAERARRGGDPDRDHAVFYSGACGVRGFEPTLRL